MPFRVFILSVAYAGAISLWAHDALAGPVKVACVGEQSTHSDQLNRNVEYPAMLQKMLGPCADVQNFGDCCATALQAYPMQPETHPYLSPPAGRFIPSFHESVAFAPDVVVIGSWGKHDTEIANSLYAGVLDPVKFQADYEQLVTTYLSLPSRPTVYASTPLPIPSGQPMGVTTIVILPAIQKIAAKYHLTIVPLYDKFLNQPQLYKDATHPTDVEGLQTIANSVYQTLTAGGAPAAGAGCGAGLVSAGGAADPDGGSQASSGNTGGSGGATNTGTAPGNGAAIVDGAASTSDPGAGDAAGAGASSGTGGPAGAVPEQASGCACDMASGLGASPAATLLGGALGCVLATRRRRRMHIGRAKTFNDLARGRVADYLALRCGSGPHNACCGEHVFGAERV